MIAHNEIMIDNFSNRFIMANAASELIIDRSILNLQCVDTMFHPSKPVLTLYFHELNTFHFSVNFYRRIDTIIQKLFFLVELNSFINIDQNLNIYHFSQIFGNRKSEMMIYVMITVIKKCYTMMCSY